jgi:hypothetical protein
MFIHDLVVAQSSSVQSFTDSSPTFLHSSRSSLVKFLAIFKSVLDLFDILR